MSESRAISPEVKGLFDTVKKQADSYEKAYEMLAYNTKVFKETISKANQLIEDLQDEPKRLSNSVNEKIQNQIKILDHERDNLKKKYEFVSHLTSIIDEQEKRLREIKDFKEELNDLKDKLLSKKKEVEILFTDTKHDAEITLKNIINEGKILIQEEIESNSKQVENNIVLRQRQIEGKMIAYDEKYFNMSDQFKSDIKRLQNEIDRLSGMIDDIQRKMSLQKTNSFEDIDNVHQELKSQIKEIDNKLNTYTNAYKPSDNKENSIEKSGEKNISNMNPEELKAELKSLRERFYESEEKLNDTEKRAGLSITMAWISMLAVIVMIIVVVVSLT